MINLLQKDQINRFYVGELNMGFQFINPLKYQVVSKEYKGKVSNYYHTLRNGGISLDTKEPFNKINWDSSMVYKSVFTLFYQLDNGKYLCLHNGNIYGYLHQDYLENIRPLSDLLPKMDYYPKKNISFYEALSLFKKATRHQLSNNCLYDIDYFYNGTIDLLASSSLKEVQDFENNKYCNINIIDNLLLRDLFIEPGISLVKDNREYKYRKYHSIFYLYNNGDMYNINNNQLYKRNKQQVMDRVIKINEPLKDYIDDRDLENNHDITIPKVLQLQKKKINK